MHSIYRIAYRYYRLLRCYYCCIISCIIASTPIRQTTMLTTTTTTTMMVKPTTITTIRLALHHPHHRHCHRHHYRQHHHRPPCNTTKRTTDSPNCHSTCCWHWYCIWARQTNAHTRQHRHACRCCLPMVMLQVPSVSCARAYPSHCCTTGIRCYRLGSCSRSRNCRSPSHRAAMTSWQWSIRWWLPIDRWYCCHRSIGLDYRH
jgi:hypothetical protein